MKQKINFRKVNTIAFLTILKNEADRFLRIWQQTLLPSAITMTLYFLIFGSFIGKRIGIVENVSYMQFIAPGLIMMAVITNSYANVVSSFYSIRFQHSVEELLVAPVPNWIIVIGFSCGGVMRGLINAILVTAIALLFTDIQVHHIFITISIVLLTSILFSLAGFTNALFARRFDDVAIIPTFVLTPLTYLGGVFYSLQQLPEFWKIVSHFNPILYMVNAFRYGILGISDVPIFGAMIIIIFATVALFSLNMYLLKRGVGIRT